MDTMHNHEALERLSEMGDTHAMTELGIFFYDTCDFKKSIKLLEAVTHCETLNAIALWTLGKAYAEYNGNDKEITDRVISLWMQASLLGNKEACLCLGKTYHNGYDSKLNIEPDLEKAEHWYSEALKLGLKVSLFYLGELYHYKSPQNVEDAVMAYTYYNYFYILTNHDKDKFSSLREEAVDRMDAMEKSADEINGSAKFFRALRKSNSALLKRLSSRLNFS
jgi:TPR repeat protein